MRSLSSFLVVIALVLGTGCASRPQLRADPAPGEARGGVVFADDADDAPDAVRRNARVVNGEVPRDEVDGWVLGATVVGLGAAACCAPSLAVGGACLANPALAAASISCCLLQNPAVCATALAAPSWFTLPAAALGFGVGLTPLAAPFVAEHLRTPPKGEVVVETRELVVPDAPLQVMAW